MLPIFDGVRDVTVLSTTLRMLLAVVCGGLIGLEREYKRRPALPLPLQSDEAPEEHGHSQAQQDGGHVHLPQVCQSFHHSVHTPLSAPRRAVKQ